jgi:hypothetical protein
LWAVVVATQEATVATREVEVWRVLMPTMPAVVQDAAVPEAEALVEAE